jgi:anti-anti-sigma factor
MTMNGSEHTMVDSFRATSYDIDAGRVIVLSGELDASTCPVAAGALIAPPCSLVVVDLCDLTFMDSSGIGIIHAARKAAIDGGGDLVVSRPQPMVYRILEITGLDMWVTDWDPAWSPTCKTGRNR